MELYSIFVRRGVTHVSLKLTKKDPIHGLLSLEQSVEEGEALGVKPRSNLDRGGIPAKLRDLLQRDPPVDFYPKITLIEVTQHLDWPVESCLLAAVADGWGCVESQKGRVPMTVNEIVLEEQNGKRTRLRRQDPGAKVPPDLKCTVHQGPIPARLLMDAELLEAKAKLRLGSADENWKSRNPQAKKRAQEAYAGLLKEFDTTTIVGVHRDRIKARAEVTLED